MALAATTLIQGPNQVATVGILLKITPGSTAYPMRLQRAPDNGSGAPNVGAAIEIADLPPSPIVGIPYLDRLRASAGVQWYRYQHYAPWANGNWTPWVSGSPVVVSGGGQNLDSSQPAVYPMVRTVALTDGLFAVQAATGDGTQATRAVQIAGQKRTLVQMMTELVPNGEFDVWESTTQPHAWAVDTTAGATCAQESAAPFSGDYSLKYSNPDNASNGGWHGINTNDLNKGQFCVPFRPGLTYRVKIAAKTSRIAGGQQYRVFIYYNSGLTLSEVHTFTLQAVATWQIDTFTISVPQNADPNSQVIVQFSRNGDATATDFWVDSLRMVEDTPSISDLVAAAANTGANLIQNPDFEQGVTYWRQTSGGSLDSNTSFPIAGTKDGILLSVASTTHRIQQCDRASDLSGGQNPSTGNPIYIPVSGGDELYGQLSFKCSVTAAGTWQFGVEEYDITKTLIQRTYLATGGTQNGTVTFKGGAALQATTAYVVAILEVVASVGGGGITHHFDTFRLYKVSPPKLRVKALLSAVQAIVTATPTLVAWNNNPDEFDIGAMHDPTGVAQPNNRIIAPPIGTGIGALRLHAQVQFASNAAGFRQVQILKNGATVIAECSVMAVNGLATTLSCEVLVHRPASGDFYTVQVQQTSGGNLNVVNGAGASFFEAEQIL